MPITLKNQGPVATADAIGASNAPANPSVTRQRKRGHSKPLPITIDLCQPGRLRVGHVMSLLSISHATLYARLREGTIPPPDGKDGRRPHWKTATIKAFLDA
jgi:predicted DNA-binding transcriptional regulator AlpA